VRSRGRALVLVLTLVPLVTLLATAVAAYFAPAFSQALADAPIAGRVAGPILRQFGLASIEDRVTSFGDRSTSSGYTLELIAGYADPSRTVLFLRATPAARVMPVLPGRAELRDQFGREIRFSGGTANSATGDAAFIFAPIEWPASQLGARLTLTLTQLDLDNLSAQRPVPITGHWELRGTLQPAEGKDLPLPPSGDLGSAKVTFVKVRALPAALLLEYDLSGDLAGLSEMIPDGLKGRPAFTVRLIDPTGQESRNVGGGGSAHQQRLWEITRPGTYELVMAWEGHGTLRRTLVIP
jgi:hypothetical protein